MYFAVVVKWGWGNRVDSSMPAKARYAVHRYNYFMIQVKKNVLITGLPGIGKTTAVIRLAEELRDLHPTGFYTAELRERGVRQGFELVGFDGRRALLSHVAMKGPYRVGRYGVDIKSFEDFIGAVNFAEPETKLVIIDEVGKMECYSEKFRNLVINLLDSPKPLIATIALKSEGFISGVKKRPDVRLFELTQGSRTTLTGELVHYVNDLPSRR
jgi:nucleoside-triphosphatase